MLLVLLILGSFAYVFTCHSVDTSGEIQCHIVVMIARLTKSTLTRVRRQRGQMQDSYEDYLESLSFGLIDIDLSLSHYGGSTALLLYSISTH